MSEEIFNYTLCMGDGGFMISVPIKVKVNCIFEYDGSTYLVTDEIDYYNLNAVRL